MCFFQIWFLLITNIQHQKMFLVIRIIFAVVKKEEFNVVTWSILVAQTCPQQHNSSKCYFWSFFNMNVRLTCLFHGVMAGCIFILTPKLSQKARAQKMYQTYTRYLHVGEIKMADTLIWQEKLWLAVWCTRGWLKKLLNLTF